ncbi:DUF445 domain-containing protein [Candidatus Riflebacteria bacterium]
MLWLVIPLLSSFVGWMTNAIAVKMIFKPLKPIKIFGFVFWGLVPRRQEEIAEKIGEMIEKDLISVSEIMGKIEEMDHEETLNEMMEEIVEGKLKPYVHEKIPMSGYIPVKVFAEFKRLSVKYFQKYLPAMVKQFTPPLEKKMDIKEMVVEKVKGFDAEKLQNIILKVAHKELRIIEILGGVLGFVIGVFQVVFIKYLEYFPLTY